LHHQTQKPGFYDNFWLAINLESAISPIFTWVYQVAENGTMSLSLSQEPDWQADRLENNRGLPLTYRDRTISQAKPSAN